MQIILISQIIALVKNQAITYFCFYRIPSCDINYIGFPN